MPRKCHFSKKLGCRPCKFAVDDEPDVPKRRVTFFFSNITPDAYYYLMRAWKSDGDVVQMAFWAEYDTIGNVMGTQELILGSGMLPISFTIDGLASRVVGMNMAFWYQHPTIPLPPNWAEIGTTSYQYRITEVGDDTEIWVGFV